MEKTLGSPLNSKEIKPVNPKWNQSLIFIGRTDAEAEAPIPRPPDENWLIWKNPDAGKDWRRRRRGRQRMRWLDVITDSMHMSWASSGSWWWTGRPGVMPFMGLQRVRHNWASELNWTELIHACTEYKHLGRHVVYTLCMDSRLDSKLVVYSHWGC